MTEADGRPRHKTMQVDEAELEAYIEGLAKKETPPSAVPNVSAPPPLPPQTPRVKLVTILAVVVVGVGAALGTGYWLGFFGATATSSSTPSQPVVSPDPVDEPVVAPISLDEVEVTLDPDVDGAPEPNPR